MLVVICEVLLASVLVWFNYSAVLPLISEEWSLSGTQAGLIFAAFQVGYLVAILPAGALADRFSTRRIIAAGATGTGIFSVRVVRYRVRLEADTSTARWRLYVRCLRPGNAIRQ